MHQRQLPLLNGRGAEVGILEMHSNTRASYKSLPVEQSEREAPLSEQEALYCDVGTTSQLAAPPSLLPPWWYPPSEGWAKFFPKNVAAGLRV